MSQGFKKSPKLFGALATVGLIYSIYLLKTLLGINFSNQYSAPWILKVPLEPLFSYKASLCIEFQSLCTLRSQILHQVQPRIEKAKRAV
jgi:hypothetical protein